MEGGPPVLVPPGDDERFLAPYPAGLLTRDADIRARLTRFGLRTIGAVAELPRSALVARFGDEGARIHAHARGRGDGALPAATGPERMLLGLALEPPAEGLEAIRFVLRRLAAALADQLAARGRAAGLARLVVTHDLAFARRGTPWQLRLEQRFPEPTADAEAIERLLLARLEQDPPPAAVARLELELALVEPARGQQLPLFTPQAARDARLGVAAGPPRDRVRHGPGPAVRAGRPRVPDPRGALALGAGGRRRARRGGAGGDAR